MNGAIIGDIVGSRFEFNNLKNKNFELFTKECNVTDDSIMTLAVAKAIVETKKIVYPEKGNEDKLYSLLENMTIKYMQEIGRRYPDCGYGGIFGQWIFSDDPKPYNSYGNGAAMRISSVAYNARTKKQLYKMVKIVTGVTHNHRKGIKGAKATALAIYMANNLYTKEEIKISIEKEFYPLNFTLDDIRESYEFDVTCQGSVPQAIVAFIESTSFEDAIRNAISIGGDSDTIAAITGSIAEAYYGIPYEIEEKSLEYLDEYLSDIYEEVIGIKYNRIGPIPIIN
jgi:ADP-ribosylglycohydrolase